MEGCQTSDLNACAKYSDDIYTFNTGCPATTQCNVGNNGVIYIGLDGVSKGGVGFIGSLNITAPVGYPCILSVINLYN